VFIRFSASDGSGVLGLGYFLAERFDFLTQRSRRIDGLGWRNERTGIEIRLLPVSAMKPDAQRTGKLQRSQSLGSAR
jgi:hypothetical protein